MIGPGLVVDIHVGDPTGGLIIPFPQTPYVRLIVNDPGATYDLAAQLIHAANRVAEETGTVQP
jgi:hypothetical protein